MELMRLDRILSSTGCASRKEAAQLIKNGSVTVDGRLASSGADKFDPETADIRVNGSPLGFERQHYYMMNKPAGVVSSTDDPRDKTVVDLLTDTDRRLGLFPAGRLDKDAEGLLLLTDDGALAHRIISPSKAVYKTYYAETSGALGASDTDAFERGIVLKDGLVCLPGTLEIISSGETSTALVRIREGKYHQVKRMLASLGKPVNYLRRVAIGGLRLDDRLAPGAYRPISADELNAVFDQSAGKS